MADLNNFSLNLYQKLSSGSNDNVFISPLSISTALSMCYVGAKENTARQMRELLGYNDLSNEQVLTMNKELLAELNAMKQDGNVELNIANKLYPMTGFDIKKDYVDAVGKHFQTELHPLDFSKSAESANTINGWVEEKTNKKIKNLIAPSFLNALTRLVLVNAIYFKGNWENQFKKELTYKDDFTSIDKSKKKVDMMKLTNKKFRYESREDMKAECLEIPYAGQRIVMTIILPNEGVDFNKFEASLTPKSLGQLVNEYQGFEQPVELYMPKFKLEFSSELSSHLKALGATDAFDEVKANFKGISDISSGLYISKVVHKSFIDVNEEGTEAAAATGVIMMTRCAPMPLLPPVVFKCNRPFLFTINDRYKGTILFMGKYVNPV